jgi:hypothetical protein
MQLVFIQSPTMADPTILDAFRRPLEPRFWSSRLLEFSREQHESVKMLWPSKTQQSDIKIKPSSLYTRSSLEELRIFVTDRRIPFKYTHAQSHTKKSQTKREKAERRKLEATLYKADTAATFRLADLPLELREQIYDHFLNGIAGSEVHTHDELYERLQAISPQFREEAGSVFEGTVHKAELAVSKILLLLDHHTGRPASPAKAHVRGLMEFSLICSRPNLRYLATLLLLTGKLILTNR